MARKKIIKSEELVTFEKAQRPPDPADAFEVLPNEVLRKRMKDAIDQYVAIRHKSDIIVEALKAYAGGLQDGGTLALKALSDAELWIPPRKYEAQPEPEHHYEPEPAAEFHEVPIGGKGFFAEFLA